MLLVNEEFGPVPPNLGGDQNDRVRADLAFGETPAGGALFATSSIAWCGVLSHNAYDNNVSRHHGECVATLPRRPFPDVLRRRVERGRGDSRRFRLNLPGTPKA